MRSKPCFVTSTVGAKFCVACSGVLLSGFLLTHMAGNLLIFLGPDAYNSYGHALTSNPLLGVAEALLVVAFLAHVFLAVRLSFKAKCARPIGYDVNPNGAKGTSLIAKTMIYQGLVILVFTVLHLITFKYGPHYEVTVHGTQMRDLYRLMLEVFHEPVYVAWYVVALIIIGLHLTHGVPSMFQTLGFNHPKYNTAVKIFGRVYAWIVALGFISQPIYMLMQ